MAKPTKVTKKITNPLLGSEEAKSTSKEEEKETEEVVTPKTVTTPTVAVAKPNVADEAMSDIKATENKLNKEPKVMFMVPLAEGEKKGAVHECFINGFRYAVPKGVMSQVPESIANLLAEHYKIGMEAGSDFRIDTDNAKLDALG